MKTIFGWLSGCWAGIFIGAVVACPAKVVSLPISIVLTVVFALLAWERKKKETPPEKKP